jgi:nucleoside-diphosphate-sugar epimerase
LRVNSGIKRVMVVRVFVAGGSGALGRRLVPQLARGHQVTATATGPAKLSLLEQLGADGVVMDGLDAVSVGEAVATARPDAIVHQIMMTEGRGFSNAKAKRELGWKLRYPSWRQGFREELA